VLGCGERFGLCEKRHFCIIFLGITQWEFTGSDVWRLTR
jgi:hypothetical protein